MPKDTSFFMKSLLDALRLNYFLPTEATSEVKQEIFDSVSQNSAFNASILEMGYSNQLLTNFTPFGTLLAVIICFWILAVTARSIYSLCNKKTTVSVMIPELLNASTRLLYVFFLEVWVCCLLSIGIFDSMFDFTASIVLIWVLTFIVCFYAVLFWKSGPYLKQ